MGMGDIKKGGGEATDSDALMTMVGLTRNNPQPTNWDVQM